MSGNCTIFPEISDHSKNTISFKVEINIHILIVLKTICNFYVFMLSTNFSPHNFIHTQLQITTAYTYNKIAAVIDSQIFQQCGNES